MCRHHAAYLLAAPGGRLRNPESVSDPTLACYLPFGAECFAIYLPGSSRHHISRFRVFSFRSVSARIISYCLRCLLVTREEMTTWRVVFVRFSKMLTKESMWD